LAEQASWLGLTLLCKAILLMKFTDSLVAPLADATKVSTGTKRLCQHGAS